MGDPATELGPKWSEEAKVAVEGLKSAGEGPEVVILVSLRPAIVRFDLLTLVLQQIDIKTEEIQLSSTTELSQLSLPSDQPSYAFIKRQLPSATHHDLGELSTLCNGVQN